MNVIISKTAVRSIVTEVQECVQNCEHLSKPSRNDILCNSRNHGFRFKESTHLC